MQALLCAYASWRKVAATGGDIHAERAELSRPDIHGGGPGCAAARPPQHDEPICARRRASRTRQGFRIIPKNTVVKVDNVSVVERGAGAPMIFAHATGARMTGAWLDVVEEFRRQVRQRDAGGQAAANNDRKGAHAAWSEGRFRKQLTLVPIVDAKLRALLHLAGDAGRLPRPGGGGGGRRRNGGDQQRLQILSRAGSPVRRLCPQAAGLQHGGEAGRHRSTRTASRSTCRWPGGAGDPCYDWLTRNAPQRGFVRTVNKEPWHWEYDPPGGADAWPREHSRSSAWKSRLRPPLASRRGRLLVCRRKVIRELAMTLFKMAAGGGGGFDGGAGCAGAGQLEQADRTVPYHRQCLLCRHGGAGALTCS